MTDYDPLTSGGPIGEDPTAPGPYEPDGRRGRVLGSAPPSGPVPQDRVRGQARFEPSDRLPGEAPQALPVPREPPSTAYPPTPGTAYPPTPGTAYPPTGRLGPRPAAPARRRRRGVIGAGVALIAAGAAGLTFGVTGLVGSVNRVLDAPIRVEGTSTQQLATGQDTLRAPTGTHPTCDVTGPAGTRVRLDTTWGGQVESGNRARGRVLPAGV